MLKVIELFAGIGSQRKALKNIGLNHKIIAFCDNDKYVEKSYREIFNDYVTPNLGDITKLKILPYADLITWSFPCQDISIANNKKQGLNGKRSGLAYKVIDLIKTMPIKAPYLLMENVSNLLSKKFFARFQNLQNKLSKLGYYNYYFKINSKDCGIPQNRKRLFMISTLNNNFRFQYPQPCNLKFFVKDILEQNVSEKYFIKQESMKKAFENNKLKIINQCAYTITTKQMRWGNAGIIAIPNDKRFNPQLANPVNETNKLHQQDSSKKLSFLIDEKEYFLRVLTPRECWILMGFSNNDFDKASKVVSETQLYKQAGNSIVVDVLEMIFKAMFQLKKKSYLLPIKNIKFNKAKFLNKGGI